MTSSVSRCVLASSSNSKPGNNFLGPKIELLQNRIRTRLSINFLGHWRFPNFEKFKAWSAHLQPSNPAETGARKTSLFFSGSEEKKKRKELGRKQNQGELFTKCQTRKCRSRPNQLDSKVFNVKNIFFQKNLIDMKTTRAHIGHVNSKLEK